MANKIEIKKFLERKKEESVQRLKDESQQGQEAARDSVLSYYKQHLANIKSMALAAGVEYDKLVESMNESGIASFPDCYSGAPANLFNRLINTLTFTKMVEEEYISVKEAEKIKESYAAKIKECKHTYDSLIAVCNVNNAKDGIKILENLGFDTSEVELKKEECTTLITNIDASKLFIVKEDK